MVKNGFIHQNHIILCLNMANKYYGIEFGIEFRIGFGIGFGIGINSLIFKKILSSFET